MTRHTGPAQCALRLILSAALLLGILASPGRALADEPAPAQPGACEGALLAEGGTADSLLADCACPPKGCVRTRGYWGSKPGVVWPSGYDRDTPFFRSGHTWEEVLDTPPRGDAYFILAHQYIAAVQNLRAGASAPNSLRAVVIAAGAWFSKATPGSCLSGACQLQRSWAGIFDEYNNGHYPGGPEHCEDD